MGKRIEDLSNVEVEHLLGLGTGLALVKVRAESADTVLVAQFEPAQAREIACHLFEAAARAEYERDFVAEARTVGFEADLVNALLLMVRRGEERRHEEGA